ncbi:MAG TPA: hypothetical protein VFB96_03525 [Pirellulaceae bacterium]|nr:hypothetical protein [Pirellulaceae bacterium]
MGKGARRTSEKKKRPDEVPPGFLPTADPPRRNWLLLAISAVLLAVWMVVLCYLALYG